MNEIKFKKANKPAVCTKSPYELYIPRIQREEIIREIKQESLDFHGEDRTQCVKRFVCNGKTCLGRPLENYSELARPYIEKLKKTHRVEYNEETGDQELFIDTNCGTCKIASKCTSVCSQMNDYVERDKVIQDRVIMYPLTEVANNNNYSSELDMFNKDLEIPWDALDDKKTEIVKKYIYEERDFKYIADSLGLYNQAHAKREFYRALTKLSEYAIVRKFLEDNKDVLNDRQTLIMTKVYFENKTYTQVAQELGVTKQAIQQVASKIFKENGIKWKTFLKKIDEKLVFNTQQVLK